MEQWFTILVLKIVNDINGYVRVGIFMKLISCSWDGQLKTLMEVIGVSNSLFDVEKGEVVNRNKKKFITFKRGLWLNWESHMI